MLARVSKCFLIGAVTFNLHTAAFGGPSGRDVTQEWYVGTYVGQVSIDGTPATVTLTCPTKLNCEYMVRMDNVSNEMAPVKAKGIEVTEVRIPNANLEHMRDVLAKRPEEYDQDQNGPLLKLFKPVIKSSAKFEACVGQSEMVGPWGKICKLDQSAAKFPDVVFLVPIMNGACNTQVICAYMMFPLHRVTAASGILNQ